MYSACQSERQALTTATGSEVKKRRVKEEVEKKKEEKEEMWVYCATWGL